jgi:hypothetical protein
MERVGIKMDFPKEDFFEIRKMLAEKGIEITPEELQRDFENATGQPLSLTDEEGLTSLLKSMGGYGDTLRGMIGDYDDRMVDRYEGNGFFISTCLVRDSNRPYETAIKHPEYNDGVIIIVETYNTKEEAAKGHDKWVKIMTAEELPQELIDKGSCFISQALKELDEKMFIESRKHPRKKS